MAQSPTLILNALPQNIYAAMQPHLKVVNLKFGDVVAEPEQVATSVYFPHSGVISLVVEIQAGDLVEAAMVGRDGVVNATSALGGQISLQKGLVQVDGAATSAPPCFAALPTISRRFARSSFATSKCFLRKLNSRRGAMPAIPWKRECAVGFCACATSPSRMK